mmetsp:Transcript_32860/g.75653  ORF Transcript_32860/g.75653 Transcript_32860/m.75653 type:complete len:88 (-) Transcript_32860:40-303(-)
MIPENIIQSTSTRHQNKRGSDTFCFFDNCCAVKEGEHRTRDMSPCHTMNMLCLHTPHTRTTHAHEIVDSLQEVGVPNYTSSSATAVP